MKPKIILILFLSAVLLVSLTVGTFANYTTVSSFSTSIYPDSSKIKN